ncbi:hypothetical protein [Pseudonocardia zijingensis]|jgi:hypothetical protein|uniref:Ribbon-helix-helix CopG family protein n=1 Tax=Pseudonocardia zijingensis TaxID=153376 RepID=A0ABN1NB06_9PSEU
MATRKVTVSLDESALDHAERAARKAGLSLSAWLSRAARREAVRTGFGPGPAEAAVTDALADEREHELAEEDLRAAG